MIPTNLPPRAYVAVYRSYLPKRSKVQQTLNAAECDKPLRSLILHHWHERYYDWGDDPSFFAAQRFLKNVRRASWGVCRHDIRSSLNKGDLVVFICAKRIDTGGWRYHYIGYATVKQVIKHSDIWTNDGYKSYRRFYNLLIRGKGFYHHEVFCPWHKTWAERCDRNRNRRSYVLFNPSRTHLNLRNPLKVAIQRHQVGERWLLGDRLVRQLKKLLFRDRHKRQSLRTSIRGYSHPRFNLGIQDRADLARLRKALHKISLAAQRLPTRTSPYRGQGRQNRKRESFLEQNRIRANVSTC